MSVSVLAGAAFVSFPRGAAAAEYYVNNGNASCADSSRSALYCTISAALAAHHAAGTRIHVLPGVYREQVTMGWSGQPGNSIIIEGDAAPGRPVVVDATDDFSDPSLWTPYSGDTWLAASVNWGPTQVFLDSTRLRLATTSPDALTPGSFVYVDKAGLYVNAGGGNPGGHRITVGRRPYGFYVSNRAWVTIGGFTVTGAEARGIMVTSGSQNVELSWNTVHLCSKVGIQVLGSTGIYVGSNVISDNGDHGLSLTAGTTGCTIENNDIFRNIYPPFRKADGMYLYQATANLIRRNNLHDNQNDGEDMENGANDNMSIQNLSWKNGQIGFNHLGGAGTIHNGDVAFYNNWDGFAMDDSSTATAINNCISVVNGLRHSRFNLEIDPSSTPGFSSDYNIIWNPSGSFPVRYAGQSYERVSAYIAAAGHDAHSIQRDPLFVDPLYGDFHLEPNSPAIDAANGATPSWPATDFDDQGRIDVLTTPNSGQGPIPYADIGAFEFDPTAWTPAVGNGVPRLDHIVVVVMENKAPDEVRFAPYMADLISRSAWDSQSYAYQHQSQSDYYALWSAVGRGVTESICPAVGSPYDTENLGHLCETNGVTWRAYSEGLPSPGDPVCQKHFYARRHCPWTDWGNLNHMNERSYDDFAIDVATGTLPQMAWVIPDLCDDEHDYCGQDTIKIGDDWLSNNVPAMVKAVGPRGAVIVTWDEDDGSDGNRILTVFTGPMVKPGFVSRRFINHFSIARTICEALGMPLFAEAATNQAVTDVWLAGSGPTPKDPPPSVVLGPAMPNPFRTTVEVMLQLNSRQTVHAAVYDIAGRRVKDLVEGTHSGTVQINWDGTWNSGERAPAGVYYLRVRSESTTIGTRLVLLK